MNEKLKRNGRVLQAAERSVEPGNEDNLDLCTVIRIIVNMFTSTFSKRSTLEELLIDLIYKYYWDQQENRSDRLIVSADWNCSNQANTIL